MANVTLSVEDVASFRLRTVGQMLYPLQDMQVACQRYAVTVAHGWVLGAHGGRTDPASHYDGWRFRTVVRDVECQYYEHWKFTQDEHVMFLHRAYLHLFHIDRATHRSRQIVCVHTDPYDDSEDVMSRTCKQGLHLHVPQAPGPLQDAHFLLVASHIANHVDEILSSAENLTEAFANVVRVMRHEVVARYA